MPIKYNTSEYPNLIPTQDIITDLFNRLPLPPSPQHGYHYFIDKLFATPQLFELLQDRNIATTSTVHLGQIDNKQLASLKAKNKSKDIIPWDTVYTKKYKSTKVIQFGFKDNTFVLLLSITYNNWEPLKEKLRY